MMRRAINIYIHGISESRNTQCLQTQSPLHLTEFHFFPFSVFKDNITLWKL